MAAGSQRDVAKHDARGALFNPPTHSGQYWQALETAAPSVAVEFKKVPVRDVAELERALDELARESGNSLVVMPDIFIFNNRELIVWLAARHRAGDIPVPLLRRDRRVASTTSSCTGVRRPMSTGS